MPEPGLYPNQITFTFSRNISVGLPEWSFGVQVGSVSFDYEEIAHRKDTVVKQLRMDFEFLPKSSWVKIIRGRATFLDSHKIETDDPQKKMIESEKIFIKM